MVATSDHWVESIAKTAVGVGTYATARKVTNIEKLRNKGPAGGSFLPAISAHSTDSILLLLGIGAVTNLIFYGTNTGIAFVAKQNAEDKVNSTQALFSTAEANLAKANDLVKQKQDILDPLEQTLKDAQDALDKAKTAKDQAAIDAAQKDADKAEQDCKQPRDELAQAKKASDVAQTAYNEAEKQLNLAKSDLATKAAALDALFPFA